MILKYFDEIREQWGYIDGIDKINVEPITARVIDVTLNDDDLPVSVPKELTSVELYEGCFTDIEHYVHDDKGNIRNIGLLISNDDKTILYNMSKIEDICVKLIDGELCCLNNIHIYNQLNAILVKKGLASLLNDEGKVVEEL